MGFSPKSALTLDEIRKEIIEQPGNAYQAPPCDTEPSDAEPNPAPPPDPDYLAIDRAFSAGDAASVWDKK